MQSKIIFLTFIAVLLFSNKSICDTYWQQEVNYKLDVTLENDERTISGEIEIEYINNSPDALSLLYIKAFPNAIQKNSYADKKRRWMNDFSFASLKPNQQGSLELESLNQELYTVELDNTVGRIDLSKPVLPGDTVYLKFSFTTVLPEPDNMRMGLKGGTTKAAYWYPQMCVYDRKMGWVNSQYVGWGECYGDFGKFDVKITAQEKMVVAASGILLNREEVLPDELREKLDIKNYLKPKDEWPSFDFDEKKNKTWHYVAENVNDFAFTASSKFCIDSGSINGVKVVAYPLKHKAKKWETAVRLGKEAIETFSELYYPYQWPVIRICDAFSGMEYPMITNCSGGEPSPRFALLLYHEIGHQWFMGQVGSNQLDRPFLDEGFTTHLEHVAMEKYLGREGNYDYFTNWYLKRYAPPTEDRNARGFLPMLDVIKKGYDKPMTFSYDQGEEYLPYRYSAYYKSSIMHYSLRSIFGDSLYFEAMHYYCSQWFFKHPYEDDFKEAFEHVTLMRMDAYFQQWFYSRKKLDYAFGSMKKEKKNNRYKYTIKINRPGKFVSPIDIAVIWEQGDTTLYTVAPEGMGYNKPGYVMLPEWEQFRRFSDEYQFKVEAQRQIKKVVVDPQNLLLDVNRMNNASGFFPPIELRVDNLKYDRTPVNRYALRLRPDIWYNDGSGLLLGFHAHGSYFKYENKFSLDLKIGTESAKPEFDFKYSNPSKLLGNNSSIETRVLRADERLYISHTFAKQFKPYYSRPDNIWMQLRFNYFDFDGASHDKLEILPQGLLKFLPEELWERNRIYSLDFKLGKLKEFRYGHYKISASATLGHYGDSLAAYGFGVYGHKVELNLTRNKKQIFRFTHAHTIIKGLPPTQNLPHLSRLSPMETFVNSALFRSPGTFPTKWAGDFYPAGGWVRGYHDRVIYVTEALAFSAELIPSKFVPSYFIKRIPYAGNWLAKLTHGFFIDFARIGMNNESNYPIINIANETLGFSSKMENYISAGVSLTPPPVWSNHYIRIDFPFYLNKPAANDDEIEFRVSAAWVMPIR